MLSLSSKLESWFYNTFEVKKNVVAKPVVGRTRLYVDARALMKGQFEGGNFDMTGLDGSIRKIVGPVQKSFFYAVNPG